MADSIAGVSSALALRSSVASFARAPCMSCRRIAAVSAIGVAALRTSSPTGARCQKSFNPTATPPDAPPWDDAVTLAIVKGVMFEAVEIEFAVELAIDAHQQIEIEGCGHALGLVQCLTAAEPASDGLSLRGASKSTK